MRAQIRLNSSRNISERRKSLILFYLLEFEQNVRNTVNLYIQYHYEGEKTKGDSSLLLLTLKF
jgi:hypothetical protein